MKRLLAAGLLIYALSHSSYALGYQSPGSPDGFVNDYADLLTAQEEATLENQLGAFEQQSTHEISVVTIPNLGGDYIENFAVKLFEEWGIGKEGKDNGVLLLVAKEDRKMRIEVGYGLEGVLTDSQSNWIIRNKLTPAFQQEQYFQGIQSGVERVIAATKGDIIPTTSPQITGDVPIDLLIVVGIVVLTWLGSVLGRSRSWWLGGVIGAGAAGVITLLAGLILSGLIAFLLLVPLGLLFDFLVSRAARSHRTGSIPWWAGGHWGGSGGSSGGFGGFGGGSSGGGGASGDW